MARRGGRHAGPAIVVAVGLLGLACPSRAGAPPSITIDRTPPEDPGGTARLETIEGHVSGARPGQRVVLYARSGAWYVQPFVEEPFTEIRPDSRWSSPTHLGTHYAALLVDADFHPPPILSALPSPGPGLIAVEVVAGTPPFWRHRAVQLTALGGVVALAWALHRAHVRALRHQLHLRAEERLAERTRIAQDLYDTLLQGMLGASMQLHVAVDGLPDDSPHKPRLASALRTIAQAADEGRNVLHGLRATGTDDEDLQTALSRVAREVEPNRAVFHITVFGAARPVHPIIREEVFRAGREAVANAFRHARAKTIAVEIHYSGRALRLVVRDDGGGIPSDGRRGKAQRAMGISAMQERAQSIGARLRVRSRSGRGTVVDLSVPGSIAYRAGLPAGK